MRNSERSSTNGIRDSMRNPRIKREPHSSPTFFRSPCSQPRPAERQSRFSVYYHQVELCFVTLDAFQWPHRARPLPPGVELFIGISLSVTPHGDLVRVQ